MIKYIKNQIKNIPMIVLICILFYGIVTIATSNINSNDITFDNTNSNLNAGDMQEAIDEVFQHATDYNEIKTTIGDSTLTTTNKTLTGAINEVNELAKAEVIGRATNRSQYHGHGNTLQIQDVKSAIGIIIGGGNSNRFVFFADGYANVIVPIYNMIGDQNYSNDTSISNGVLSLPKSGYYYYTILQFKGTRT